MKIILKEYLASLKERDELDKLVLPNLLTAIGLVVLNSPMKGTRQNGVDIAALGKIANEDDQKYLYLFCIKAGNIGRANWDGGPNSVRPELNEIRDVYLSTQVSKEHSNYPVKICLCFGGELEESAMSNWAGYTKDNTTDKIIYEQWNGDRLADLMIKSLLSRELLNETARREFQKAVAMVNEPQACYDYTKSFLLQILNRNEMNRKEQLKTLRQSCICLHAIVAWSRGIGNLEGVYRITELGVLLCWNLMREIKPTNSKKSHEYSLWIILEQFFEMHLKAADDYIEITAHSFCKDFHALSFAVKTQEPVDVNLSLFELLGRVAIRGIWAHIFAKISSNKENPEYELRNKQIAQKSLDTAIDLINSNPTLLTPYRDDHMIEIALVMYLAQILKNEFRVSNWLLEIADRCSLALLINSKYPTCFSEYTDLLNHPLSSDQEYRDEACAGSILYPYLYIWITRAGDADRLERFRSRLHQMIPNCTHQSWLPDEETDKKLWIGSHEHGICITNLGPDRPIEEIVADVNLAIESCTALYDIGAFKIGLVPLYLAACRHYRLPISPQFWVPHSGS